VPKHRLACRPQTRSCLPPAADTCEGACSECTETGGSCPQACKTLCPSYFYYGYVGCRKCDLAKDQACYCGAARIWKQGKCGKARDLLGGLRPQRDS
jgi:hypothetical protein